MTIKDICNAHETFAVICFGYLGYELKHIEYTPDGDFLYFVSGHHGRNSYHKLKIHYNERGAYVNTPSRTYLENAVRI